MPMQQTIHYEIVRETSQYNKYIKWFLRTYSENHLVCSLGLNKIRKTDHFQ